MGADTKIEWADLSLEQRILASGRVRVDDEGRIYWARNGKRAEHRTPQGYLQVRVMLNGVRMHAGAHRVVWVYFNGPIPDGFVINHLDGNKAFNKPSNIECCTPSENAKHAHRTGLVDQRGSRNPISKLTADQVAQLRSRYAAGGVTQVVLAAQFGVSFQTVSKLVRGERRTVDPGAIGNYQNRRSSAVRKKAAGRLLDGRTWDEVPA